MAFGSTQRLIAAIQTANPDALRSEVAGLQAEWASFPPSAATKQWRSDNPVNATFGQLELTALHVAAKAYAIHHADARLARAFDEMVQILLDAGANPAMEMGAERGRRFVAGVSAVVMVRPGQTVAEVCGRHLPPSLAGWFAINVDERWSTGRAQYSEEARMNVLAAAQRRAARRRGAIAAVA